MTNRIVQEYFGNFIFKIESRVFNCGPMKNVQACGHISAIHFLNLVVVVTPEVQLGSLYFIIRCGWHANARTLVFAWFYLPCVFYFVANFFPKISFPSSILNSEQLNEKISSSYNSVSWKICLG